MSGSLVYLLLQKNIIRGVMAEADEGMTDVILAVDPGRHRRAGDAARPARAGDLLPLVGESAHAAVHLADVRSRFAPGFTQPTACGQASCGEWYDAEAG